MLQIRFQKISDYNFLVSDLGVRVGGVMLVVSHVKPHTPGDISYRLGPVKIILQYLTPPGRDHENFLRFFCCSYSEIIMEIL